MSVEPRNAINQVRPYIPGKPIEEVKREFRITGEIVKLASNENPIGTSPMAIEAMQKEIPRMYLYPDDECFYLKKRLASHLDVSPSNIMVSNGSVETMLLATLTYLNPKDVFISGAQSFAMAKISAKLMGGSFKEIPEANYRHNLDAIKNAIDKQTKIVYIDNPCNPLGTKLSRQEIGEFVNSVPDGILIILDEAYYEFVKDEDFPHSIDFIKQGKNVLILRTFSKIYGLAGLRVGYGISSENIIATINKTRLPFSVNRLAQVGALAALEDNEHIRKTLEINKEGKKYLQDEFARMGIFYIPSLTNFITIKTKLDGKKLFTELQKRGVIVRPLANYGMPEFVRITIGTMKQNQRFVKTLKQILQK